MLCVRGCKSDFPFGMSEVVWFQNTQGSSSGYNVTLGSRHIDVCTVFMKKQNFRGTNEFYHIEFELTIKVPISEVKFSFSCIITHRPGFADVVY